MKKMYTVMLGIFFLQSHNLMAELNEFGISTNVPPKKISFAADNAVFKQRITEELPNNFRVADILEFIKKIEQYVDHLLDTDNKNSDAIMLARLAVIDMKKAKKMLHANQVNRKEEHDLRLALIHIDKRVESLVHPYKTFQE